MSATFELFMGTELIGGFDCIEEAMRAAARLSQPWAIWRCEAGAAAIVARGDGSWRATHELTYRSFEMPAVEVRFKLMATPDGQLFTEQAWNRGAPPEFVNTGAGIRRADGRKLPVSTILYALQ